MPVTVQSLGINRLPIDEQIALVREIWNRIIAIGAVRRSMKHNYRNFAGVLPRMTPTPIT